MSDRPAFLSLSGLIVGTAALLGVLTLTSIGGPGLFSSGALSSKSTGRTYGGVTTHAQLTRDCGACHTAPWSQQTMADRCLACHTEVTTQIQASSGLHGHLVGGVSSPTCRGCHTEHGGSSGTLTVVNAATFPHDLTGYFLQSHRRKANGTGFTCADCHPKGLATFDQATCAVCHTTIDAAFVTRHETAFGKKCLLCHDGTGRGSADFDHSKLAFKLVGKHAGLACDRCHSSVISLQALRKTPQNCQACHAKDDRHKGKFGAQCGQCHTPDSWANAKFDHGIFPIDHGSREQVPTCQTCHPTDVSTYTCYGCHTHTPASVQGEHEGRSITQLTDCIRCHAGGRREGGD